MVEDFSDYDLFITEFPKKGYNLIDYLQGRVHFAVLDQMKLMHTSGMTPNKIRETIMTNIVEIIDHFESEKKSESS
ncbi:MAG: hypothetical protein OEL56_00865 [Nitrosopumilus sp.]|nr:hypothetical protein [Nitrosopumilus sp.]MDH3515337.1 hypothetical protein [Nitrosopumilus sp.]MDH3564361.1 hypothetical protein [Nitrosopumilus sp.]MDH5418295.1 hypothetical protein [Nitrosopumilus sp.]MDH5418407.1 hypothetical protein [Nitrosopumilus sp.]